MAWQDEMVPILQVLLNDISGTTYDTDNLEQILVVAAMQVNNELDLTTDYSTSIENVTISPDPTLSASRDDSFINLVTLKAACIVDRGAAAAAASQAIAVKDGTSAIDLRGALQGKLALLKTGWCAVYNDTKQEFLLNRAAVAGQVVMTPFRAYATGGLGSLLRVPGRDRDSYS